MTHQQDLKFNYKWNPEFAYAVGLIATDGYLSSDKRHISFTSTDLELIRTFKKCLKLTNIITKDSKSSISKKQAYRIQFGNVKLYNYLLTIGLTTNKSLTINKLNIPNDFFPDFLRGSIDGDGSIIYYKDSYNTKYNPKYVYDRLFVYLISASNKHIKWLQYKIIKMINIHGSVNKILSKSQRSKTPIYRLKFSTKEAKVLLNWIYYKRKLPYLVRKHEKAKPFLQI